MARLDACLCLCKPLFAEDATRRAKDGSFCFFFYREKDGSDPVRFSGLYYIEQVAGFLPAAMSKCPYGVGFTQTATPVALYCGKWSCERCRRSLAKQWAWRVRLHIQTTEMSAYAWHFTLPGYIKTPYQGFSILPVFWDRLRRNVQGIGADWTYLAFVECHPKRSKIPHFHCISMLECPVLGSHVRTPIKDLAVMSGFGYMALEEPIAGYKAANYVAKYASKHDPAMPRNFRRVRASQDWTHLPEQENEAYMVQSKTESIADFVLRVANATGVEADTIYRRYRTANNLYEVNNYDLD